MQITKKQHYIPQGLIKHFSCGDKDIFELNKKNKLYKNSIRNTMCQNLVYEHEDLPANLIEDFFAKKENYFIPKHDQLVLKVEQSYIEKKEIPISDINKILQFYVFVYLRSGALLVEYSAFSSNPESQRIEKMLGNILDSDYLMKLTKTILKGYTISIIVSEEKSFLMSDQFISTASLKFKNKFTNVSNRQIGFKDTIIFIPLTSKYYIVFYHGNKPDYIKAKEYSILNTDEINQVNSIIENNSYNKTISSKREPLEKIKLKENKINSSSSPMVAIEKYENGNVRIFNIKKELEFYDSELFFSINYINKFIEYINKYKGKIGRNDICLCGSEIKYKKCCNEIHQRCLNIIRKTQQVENKSGEWYAIDPTLQVEREIKIYEGPKRNIPDFKHTDILNQISAK